VNRALVRAVRERAEERCEYCRLPQSAAPIPFQIDHIIAAKHGGLPEPENLALACPHCNLHKGPNIGGRDPGTGQFSPLFHPRTDQWTDHFLFEGPKIIGRTLMGTLTIDILAMNADGILALRAELLQEGVILLP
jgi:hypothetical protein